MCNINGGVFTGPTVCLSDKSGSVILYSDVGKSQTYLFIGFPCAGYSAIWAS